MTLNDLHDELRTFDWYYDRSDDHRVYCAGRDRWSQIETVARTLEGGPELVAAWQRYIASGRKEELLPKRRET
jgi:hypothetical protein